jgi:hypothetical protein
MKDYKRGTVAPIITPRPISIVDNTAGLEDNLGRLYREIEELEKLLSPILSEAMKMEDGERALSDASELFTTTSRCSSTVSELIDYVISISRRVQL